MSPGVYGNDGVEAEGNSKKAWCWDGLIHTDFNWRFQSHGFAPFFDIWWLQCQIVWSPEWGAGKIGLPSQKRRALEAISDALYLESENKEQQCACCSCASHSWSWWRDVADAEWFETYPEHGAWITKNFHSSHNPEELCKKAWGGLGKCFLPLAETWPRYCKPNHRLRPMGIDASREARVDRLRYAWPA